jgi:hypothetical protein
MLANDNSKSAPKVRPTEFRSARRELLTTRALQCIAHTEELARQLEIELAQFVKELPAVHRAIISTSPRARTLVSRLIKE